MIIRMVGDLHGNLGAFTEVHQKAEDDGVDLVISQGDYGWWPRLDEYQEYLAGVERLLLAGGPRWDVVEGNHDDHDDLNSRRVGDEAVTLGPRLRWMPRGYRFEADGVKYLVCGGAVSVDKGHRVLGVDWFDTEAISWSDTNRCIDGGPADVLLSHDAPEGYLPDGYLWEKTDTASDGNRRMVRGIVEACDIKVVVHGHYHQAHRTTTNGVTVIGLSHESHEGNTLTVVNGQIQ